MRLVRQFEVSAKDWFGKEEEHIQNWVLKLLRKVRLVKIEKEAIIDKGLEEVIVIKAVAPKRHKYFVIVVDKSRWKARVYASKWIPNNKIVYIYQKM